jgi:hypothetical protein
VIAQPAPDLWSAPLGLDRLGPELTGPGFPRKKAYAEKTPHVQH